jgi:hypothetical protein
VVEDSLDTSMVSVDDFKMSMRQNNLSGQWYFPSEGARWKGMCGRNGNGIDKVSAEQVVDGRPVKIVDPIVHSSTPGNPAKFANQAIFRGTRN